MNHTKQKSFKDTWFFKWILDNQAVAVLMITFLVFLTIFLLTKISFLLTPVVSIIAIIMLPMAISGLLFYLTKPMVDFVERRGRLNRSASILFVFAIILLLIIWAMSGFIPMMMRQLSTFVKDLPDYIYKVNKEATLLLDSSLLKNYQTELQNILSNISSKAVGYAESVSKNALEWASTFASAVAKVTVAIIMSPFILFYLLKDGDKMKGGLVKVFPTKFRRPISRILSDVNSQLSGYVQGQVTVAIVVGIMFAIMYSLVGLRYGVTLGIIAGILNMVPYLGSFLAQVPVYILALVAGPMMVLKVSIVFIIEQTLEGRFVSPLVLGNKLSIHPITIMFILLVAGSMFGVWGVFLGIPIYASVKVVVKELFDWYKTISGLYDD